jgi:metalloendopeptidase OMA1, mitochondrial
MFLNVGTALCRDIGRVVSVPARHARSGHHRLSNLFTQGRKLELQKAGKLINYSIMISFMRLRKYFVLATAMVVLAGCTTGPKFIPRSMLNEQSASIFTQMKQEMPVSKDAAASARVKRIGERIAKVVEEEMPGVQWEFVLFDDPAINAFALPGGQVGIYKGLLDLSESDDEVAIVIGHEIAHVTLEHGNQRMSAEVLRGLGGVALAYGTRNRNEQEQMMWMAAYGLGSQVGFMLPYSRNHEYEADRIGMIYAAKAGYDPRAAVSFWEKMGAASQGGAVPEFLSTHPGYGNRIQRLQANMLTALQFYDSAGE